MNALIRLTEFRLRLLMSRRSYLIIAGSLVIAFFITVVAFLFKEYGDISSTNQTFMTILTHNVISFVAPVYLFLYLFFCILVLLQHHDSLFLQRLLAKGKSRIDLILSMCSIPLISGLISLPLFTILLIMFDAFEITDLLLLVVLHVLAFAQVQFIFLINMGKAALLLYLILFLGVPVLFKDALFLLAAKYDWVDIIDPVFAILQLHIDVLTGIFGDDPFSWKVLLSALAFTLLMQIPFGYRFIKQDLN